MGREALSECGGVGGGSFPRYDVVRRFQLARVGAPLHRFVHLRYIPHIIHRSIFSAPYVHYTSSIHLGLIFRFRFRNPIVSLHPMVS